MQERVDKLHALADRTGNPAEAAAFRAKAESLEQKYGLPPRGSRPPVNPNLGRQWSQPQPPPPPRPSRPRFRKPKEPEAGRDYGSPGNPHNEYFEQMYRQSQEGGSFYDRARQARDSFDERARQASDYFDERERQANEYYRRMGQE